MPTAESSSAVESVIVKKNGCPRQGAVPAPARLKPLYGSSPSQTAEGLDKYSHVWLLFLFHDYGIHKVASSSLLSPSLPPSLLSILSRCRPW
jgi:hypothetical protein